MVKLQGKIDKVAITLGDEKKMNVTVSVPYYEGRESEIESYCNNKEIDVEIKQHRDKRSLDANSYLWVLLGKLQQAMNNGSSTEELYLLMLERYGTFTFLPVPEASLDFVYAVYRVAKDRGSTVLTSKSGKKIDVHTMQVWKGSSQYNTKEMSVLLEGVVSECKDYGIDTVSPTELREIKQKWGVNVA